MQWSDGVKLHPSESMAETDIRKPSIIRFSIFELDLKAGELRRNGKKVKIQEQPFQILAALLERPGEVVTREELRSKLWPSDTFVDFDHSLNAAIKRLRDALGESAETPVFVETLARRGYRFIGNVQILGAPSALSNLNGLPTSASGPWTWKWQLGGMVLALVVVASLIAGWFFLRHTSRSKLSQASVTVERLTTHASE